jgi:heat shock protein HtpX
VLELGTGRNGANIMNYLKTTVLLAALAGLFMLIGGLLGGQQGALLALLVAGVMNFVTYWF